MIPSKAQIKVKPPWYQSQGPLSAVCTGTGMAVTRSHTGPVPVPVDNDIYNEREARRYVHIFTHHRTTESCRPNASVACPFLLQTKGAGASWAFAPLRACLSVTKSWSKRLYNYIYIKSDVSRKRPIYIVTVRVPKSSPPRIKVKA